VCGRFALDKQTDDEIREFVAAGGKAEDWATSDWQPSWNIAPTTMIPTVIKSSRGEGAPIKRLELARWSLTPSWSKTLKVSFTTFNAVADELSEKPTYRGPMKRHRAIIPVTGYYEWRKNPPDGKTTTPFYVSSPEQHTLGLAGLYSWWKNPALAEDHPDLWTLTTTILTSTQIDQLIGIHDRNPVPLPREKWDDWLNPEIEADQHWINAMVATAFPVAATLSVREVAKFNNKMDGVYLTEPVASLEGTEDWLSTES
jgi:putative SOS response-associated peptidase YedK